MAFQIFVAGMQLGASEGKLADTPAARAITNAAAGARESINRRRRSSSDIWHAAAQQAVAAVAKDAERKREEANNDERRSEAKLPANRRGSKQLDPKVDAMLVTQLAC